MFVIKISGIQKQIWPGFGKKNLINKHLRLRIPYTHNTDF